MNNYCETWSFISSSILMPDDAKLDSPIERAFYRCFRYLELGFHKEGTLEIRPQVKFDKYRADFAVFDSHGFLLLVVERDGHDFHDGNKVAAQRDKERDRWFASNGMTVFRFTGSEIYASPFGVAAEALSFAHQKSLGGKCQPG